MAVQSSDGYDDAAREHNEKLDIFVDGELLSRPHTIFK